MFIRTDRDDLAYDLGRIFPYWSKLASRPENPRRCGQRLTAPVQLWHDTIQRTQLGFFSAPRQALRKAVDRCRDSSGV
jgi:hypothetical protein